MNQIIEPLTHFDFSPLQDTEPMLTWLHPNPYDVLMDDIKDRLENPSPFATIQAFIITSKPIWLTLLTPHSTNNNKTFQSKAGVAFEFKARLMNVNNIIEDLYGVYTWIGRNILEPEAVISRTWVDKTARLDSFGSDGLLGIRLATFNE